MKLTKTVLAVAIAGIAATPMMASATTTLSGAVQLRFSGSDDETDFTNSASTPEDGFEEGEARITTGDVLIGVNASQALNSGLTGYGSLRIDLDDFSGGTGFSGDNVYIGVKGGFGDLRIGEVANPGEYGQLLDIVNDMGTTINQGVGYVGSFGGATIGASFSPAPNQDLFGVGVKFAIGGFSIGAGLQNEDELNNISAQAGFAFAGASVGLGFAQLEEGFGTEDETAISAKVGYSIAGVSLALSFQQEQESEDAVVRLDAGYGLGGGMDVSTRINSFSGADDSADATDWRIQFAKSF